MANAIRFYILIFKGGIIVKLMVEIDLDLEQLDSSVPAGLTADDREWAVYKEIEARKRKEWLLDICKSKELFEVLSKDKDSDIRKKIAGDSEAPEKVLEELSHDESEEVRSAVGGNSSTPEEVLKKLKDDKCARVRKSVAGNPSASREDIDAFANDPDPTIRVAVAGNLSASREVFDKLVNDAYSSVRVAMAGNPTAPPEVVECLYDDPVKSVRVAVAKRTDISRSTIVNMMYDKKFVVQATIVENPITPKAVLREYKKDQNHNQLAALAAKELKRRKKS